MFYVKTSMYLCGKNLICDKNHINARCNPGVIGHRREHRQAGVIDRFVKTFNADATNGFRENELGIARSANAIKSI